MAGLVEPAADLGAALEKAPAFQPPLDFHGHVLDPPVRLAAAVRDAAVRARAPCRPAALRRTRRRHLMLSIGA